MLSKPGFCKRTDETVEVVRPKIRVDSGQDCCYPVLVLEAVKVVRLVLEAPLSYMCSRSFPVCNRTRFNIVFFGGVDGCPTSDVRHHVF